MRINGAPNDQSFTGANCVVTGGAGFIGSNLVHRLTELGATVRVIDALVPGHGGDRRNLDGIDQAVDLLEADIGDAAVAPMLRDADLVFNLAGQVSHLDSMTNPEADLFYNAITHCRFLEMLRHENPTARVVHASTRQVYGRALHVPVDEQHRTRPLDVNGVAKLAGEQLHLVYANAHRIPITSLRLTNVYGPRQRLTSNVLGFLPVFIRTALTGGTIELFGDGRQRRDCLHVDDVVDACLRASGTEGIGGVFNIGHRTSHSLARIAQVLTEIAPAPTTIRLTPWPDDHERIDIGSFESDSGAAERELGWTARTEIADGLRSTLAFYREHPWYLGGAAETGTGRHP